MNISDFRSWNVREPGSGRIYSVIRVQAGSGVTGYGECRELPPDAKQKVLGLDPSAFESARKRLEPDPGLNAAFNMAALDIAGKTAKAPLYQVLGGPTRHKVRAMTALDERDLSGSLAKALQAGYKACSVPAPEPAARNQGQAYARAVMLRLETLRKAAGDGVDFVLDGGSRLSPGDAAVVAAEMERFHPLWFDEPCRTGNNRALEKISAECVTPIGYGRHAAAVADFQGWLREQVIDIARPDLARHGITAIKRIAAIAESYYTAVAPFHDGGPIATAAALHLAACLPNFFIQQIPLPAAEEDRRMRVAIAGGAVETIRGGFAGLPTGHGLGINVNEQALQRYSI
jgi:galactonate dehydratase